MEPLSQLNLTTIIAAYSAVAATFVLGWNIFRDITDKGRLKVHCYIGNIIIPGGPTDNKDYLIYSVTNTGRRSVLVTHVGGKKKRHDFMIVPRDLPKKLQPGDHLMEYSDDLSCLNRDLKSLFAIDSLGKAYKVKQRTLRNLKKEGWK